MSKSFKVPFAFKLTGELIDIPSADKGTIYKCACGLDVKLRGGDFVSDHFYHINGSSCSLETAIHKAYKSVFEKIKAIKLPYEINGVDILTFDKVEIEKKIDDYIPDAIGYIGEDKYLVEFAKSSYIGVRKENKIRKSNLFCIEVDIIKTVETLKEIEDHLINEKYYKHIIHAPKYKLHEELKQEYLYQIKKLKEEVHRLNKHLQLKTELFENLHLDYKKMSKNGARMYARYLPKHKVNAVAFVKRYTLSIYMQKKITKSKSDLFDIPIKDSLVKNMNSI